MTKVKKIRLEQDVQDTLDVIDTTGTGSKFLNDAWSYEEVGGWGGWLVDWLDGLVIESWWTPQYRANYRGETTWSWSWVTANWLFRDTTTKCMYLTVWNNIEKRSANWFLIDSINLWTNWWILLWNIDKRILFTSSWHKIDLTTFSIEWTISDVIKIFSISDNWELVLYKTTWTENNNFKVFDTETLTQIWTTFSINTNSSYPAWWTLSRDWEIMVGAPRHDWTRWKLDLHRINIDTWIIIDTKVYSDRDNGWYFFEPNNNQLEYILEYSSIEDMVYVISPHNTWWSPSTICRKVNSDLSGNPINVTSSTATFAGFIWKDSLWNIYMARYIGSSTTNVDILYNNTNKSWSSIWTFGTPNNKSYQIWLTN